MSEQQWLEDLKQNLPQSSDSNLLIYAGSTKVYEQVCNEVTVNKLEGDMATKVQQALETPQELKGSVRIISDGEIVFHAKQGKLLENNLSPLQSAEAKEVPVEQEIEAEAQAESKIENEAEAVAVQASVVPAMVVETPKELSRPDSVPPSWDDVRNLIATQQQPDLASDAILNLLAYQSQQIEQMQQKLDALQKMNPPLNAQVGQFFNSLKNAAANSIQEVKQRSHQLPQDIRQFLGNKAAEIQQAVAERVNTVKQDVIGKVDDFKATVVNHVNATKEAAIGFVADVRDSVDQSLADMSAKALDTANRWLVNKFGKDQGETGVKVWAGKDYSFTASGQHTSILNKSGQEIARDGKLTSAATQQDASRLSKLPQDIQQIAQKLQHQQKQVAGVGLKQ